MGALKQDAGFDSTNKGGGLVLSFDDLKLNALFDDAINSTKEVLGKSMEDGKMDNTRIKQVKGFKPTFAPSIPMTEAELQGIIGKVREFNNITDILKALGEDGKLN